MKRFEFLNLSEKSFDKVPLRPTRDARFKSVARKSYLPRKYLCRADLLPLDSGVAKRVWGLNLTLAAEFFCNEFLYIF